MGNSAVCTCGQGLAPPVKQKLLDEPGLLPNSLESWEFCSLDLDAEQLGLAAFVILQAFFLGCGGIDQDLLAGFVCGARDGYLPNPYHNFAHAVDVLHTMLRLSIWMPWDELFGPAARFAMLVAALGHDLGHPGFSNMFLIDAGDEMADRYNDISPLENMHCARLFHLIAQEHCRVFEHLPQREFKALRKMMIDAILHTDASHHDVVLKILQALYDVHSDEFDSERGGRVASGLTTAQLHILGTDSNRRLMSRVLLLGSDESNQAKPWRAAYAWAELLRDELVAQGDLERSLGFPVAPINDRCAMSLAEAQLGQLQLIAAPLLAAEVSIFRGWAPLAGAMARNVRSWGARLAKESFLDAPGQELPDKRVEALCRMLGDSRTTVHRSGEKLMASLSASVGDDEVVANEPCSEPSCPEVGSAPLVREIRRWRENQTLPGHQRELVLLYIVSDEGSGQRGYAGQPILYRYAVQPPEGAVQLPGGSPGGSAPSSPPRGAGPPAAGGGPKAGSATVTTLSGATLSAASPSSTIVSRPNYSESQAAQAWCESSCRQLEPGKFEALLGSVLEDLPDILAPESRPSNVTPQVSKTSGSPGRRTSFDTIRSPWGHRHRPIPRGAERPAHAARAQAIVLGTRAQGDVRGIGNNIRPLQGREGLRAVL